MKVAFFGTPDFAIPSLRALFECKEHEVVCVVCQPDKPSGRGMDTIFSPVKKFATQHNIPVLQPEKISKEVELLDKHKPDIIVTCAFGQILRQNVLDYCKHGVINVHASLLPKYRGSSPIQWTIINGETQTGITIMQTDIGMDTGDILYQVPCDIGETETAGELFNRLSVMGAEALLHTLDVISRNEAIPRPQNHAEATHFPMLKKESGRIDFNKSPKEIVNFVRGMNPWPCAYFKSNLGDIRVHKAGVSNGKLRFEIIQMAGGKPMTYKEFTNGRKLEIQYHDLPTVEKELTSKDGTKKFLLKLSDGALIECVLLTQDYGNTACISSQVGCKMCCAFCASGADGFVRDLTAQEMLAQVESLRAQAKQSHGNITNVVLMGSGEPFDNFDNTVEFLKLTDVGARHISVSTVGIPEKIKRFADLGLQVNLCISLHAPNDEVRRKIMPVAKKYSVKEIIDAARYFFNKTKRRVIFEYALIDGMGRGRGDNAGDKNIGKDIRDVRDDCSNCMEEHARELVRLLKGAGFASHVNLINLNANGNLKPPTREVAMKFMDALIKGGISCTMRKSKGSDIAGACGQLRIKFVGQQEDSNG